MYEDAAEADVDADAGTDADADVCTDAEGTEDVPDGDETDADDGTTTDLADQVGEYDADLGTAVGNLQARIEELEAELAEAEERADDLESQLKRTQADFQNYKKRAKERQEEVKERATEDFIERLVSVRDDLVRALDQNADADIRDGVASTLASFDRVLESENVEPIEPDPGTAVDPTRHQVMMRVESDQPEGTVVDVYRPGYEMAGSIVQEAQVTVSEGS